MDKKILLCKCKGEIIDEKKISQVEQLLHKTNIQSYLLEDLCGLCSVEKEKLNSVFKKKSNILLIACNPRSIYSLLHSADFDIEQHSIQYLNFLTSDIGQICSQIEGFSGPHVNGQYNPIHLVLQTDWQPWFPVIDYNRCTNCGQCADFCLFSVYSQNHGKVVVNDPQSCKNNCPACARICPSLAIIFPKYKHGGAISGSNDFNEQKELLRQKNDIDNILGGDIYSALANRKNKKQQIVQGAELEKALKEREKALKKNKKAFNPLDE